MRPRTLKFLQTCSRNRDALMVIALLLAVLLACGGDDTCRLELTYEGKTMPGAGKTLADAKRGGCWKYCIDHDETIDRAWKKWKKAKGSKSKAKTSDLMSAPGLKRALSGCEDTCLSDVKAGKGEFKNEKNCD